MLVPRGTWRARGAVVLASGAAISLTALSAGMVPALAEPVTTTTVEVVPTEEVVTEEVPTTVEAPPTTQAPVITQAPQIVTTQAPVVTQAPEIVTTQAPVVTQAPEIVTTTAEPIPTPVTTPKPTDPLPTVTGPLPTATGPLPTATGPLPTPTGPLPTATGLLPTPTGPLPTATGPLPTATGPLPTATGPLPTGTTAATTTAVQGAQVTPLEEPQRVEAAPQDVQVAKASVPVEQEPPPAPQSEIDSIKDALNIPVNSIVTTAPTPAAVLTSNVKQWQPDWVRYDEFYRPVIFNPYREPLQIVYLVAGAPRVLVIQPLASIVTEVAQLGAYSFTAMVLNAVGIPTNVAVGTFLGGGYVPGPGQPPPAPPPVKRYDDVPVVVKYAKAEYKPFRVQKIIDVGPDPSVGEHKVLLDGVTPAWGEWKQTETGAQQFEVHKTQSFPGMEEPQEGPLPGDYPLQLVSDSSPTGMSAKDVALIGGAVVVALLAVGAIVFTIFLGRRRPQH